MVFRVYLLAVKAPGISLEEFKEQWDVHHLNLLKEIAGDAYPQTHCHHYPKQPKARRTPSTMVSDIRSSKTRRHS
ncbi:uncharacterized protein CC84DRAFT_1162550 [Paraphaeosphaeria sporulosa]|uniref:EthD domain-containing protein n=1 Tax=Paraphaeosphaeria sporulosa TaxID=1460663 RepID=A0A177CN17_9PLEO|nr:uncharacterized protein CC84DRAFT_1162550 [Paraphaeosphaeria sporulosa]OAG08641.1 hypothetical protein CC84DRAFT_1162550 [Paraphaeosphaeria sporulosa]